MSAIVGIFHLDGHPAENATLQRMMARLAHRGPDDRGTWVDGPIALGHLMLWTTPESTTEKLPFADRESGLVITSAARIDNREELHHQVNRSGPPLSTVSDSYLILKAYERWGARCVEKLIGDFAFCVWNRREQKLFCARDPFATKHFYYYHLPGEVFAFASEIKALLTLPFVTPELNELAVACHLVPIYDDKSSTFYKGIHRLPASECMSIDPAGLSLSPAWKPDLTRELRLRSDAEYAEAFREVFTEAVRCRIRSYRPVGSMLSGGLDSSSITCTAAQLLAQAGQGPLKTFSAIWPGIAERHSQIDERPFMNAVIDTGGFEPYFVHLDHVSPLANWQTIYWHEDQPLSAPNMYMDWAIFKAAHDQGVRVLLGGTDGDTVVSYGYQDLPEFVRRGRWLKLIREARALSRRMPRGGHALKALVWHRGFRQAIADLARSLRQALLDSSKTTRGENEWQAYAGERPLDPHFMERLRLKEHLSNLLQEESLPNLTSREIQWADISSGNWAYILESFEKAAAAHHVEVRHPFFDRRLVEFCIALPPGQRLLGGYTRSILRRAMSNILPPAVQWRTDKGNLSAGVCLNLLEYEHTLLEQLVVADDTSPLRAYVDITALRASYRKYLEKPVGSEREAFWLMLAVPLALWLKVQHFEPTDDLTSYAPTGVETWSSNQLNAALGVE